MAGLTKGGGMTREIAQKERKLVKEKKCYHGGMDKNKQTGKKGLLQCQYQCWKAEMSDLLTSKIR